MLTTRTQSIPKPVRVYSPLERVRERKASMKVWRIMWPGVDHEKWMAYNCRKAQREFDEWQREHEAMRRRIQRHKHVRALRHK